MDNSETLHIIPLNDFREHESSCDCWCKPQLTDGLDNCYTHPSADGREYLEDLILTRAEIYLHIARVAALWFSDVVTFSTNCNDDSAINWLQKRKAYLQSLSGDEDLQVTVFKSYLENFLQEEPNNHNE
jgi:hypothetical protein